MTVISRHNRQTKPIKDDVLYIYLDVTGKVMSTVLVKEEHKVQRIGYRVRKRLIDVESRFWKIEKFACTLLVASQKLIPACHHGFDRPVL